MKTDICLGFVERNALFNRTFRRVCASALVICVFVLLAAQRVGAAAAVFPPQGDDVTPSMGLFRIIVDPLFQPLMGPTGSPFFFAGYPGFHSSDGRLTSPMLIDSATTIGRSNPNPRPTPFPQPLGAGSWDVLTGYGNYPAIPFAWFAAPAGTAEVLTEIKTFVLQTVGGSTGDQGCTNPLVPMAPPNYPMVKAGTFAGVSPRSLGIVQEDGPPGLPDFPARSFFDIFVEVNLPPLPGTESSVAFPATGAIVTNGAPLIVTNLNLGSFPPEVIYIHGGNTNAVQLRFKFDNPPYWSAGDLFGTLVLAGHGTFTNDCSQEAALAAAVLGTPTAPMPETPPEWLRTTTLIPSPGSSYQSLMTDTNPPGGSDTLVYQMGTFVVYIRNIIHFNFPVPIPPPPPGDPVIYTDPASQVSLQISLDQQTWYPATASGPLSVIISNTTPTGSSMSTFQTWITQMNLTGGSEFGTFMLRQSTSQPSMGMHTIRPDPRGYRVSSFFDVFTELSTDGGNTWIPSDRSVRMLASAPPAAPGKLFLSKNAGGSGATLEWLGPFTVQSSLVITGGFKDVSGSTGGPLINSWSVSPTPNQQFFRLRQ